MGEALAHARGTATAEAVGLWLVVDEATPDADQFIVPAAGNTPSPEPRGEPPCLAFARRLRRHHRRH